jgi:4-hydroxybenzoate polyprenyltransferase
MIARLPPSLQLLRPSQWLKNAFVFAALIFAQRFTDPSAIGRTVAAAATFCLLSGAVYVLNDLWDCPEDRAHPSKRHRPIAAGRVSVGQAVGMLLALLVLGVGASVAIGSRFALVAMGYLALNAAYTFWLKHVVIVDVMVVAANYVLRVVAGAIAIAAPVTPWLLVASMLLALFLALGKRRHELVLLGEHATTHRAILREYSPAFLDQLIAVVTPATVIAYSLYALDRGVAAKLGTGSLPLTIPFVLFGIFRYLYLIHQRQDGGDPTTLLFRDRPLLASVALWSLLVVVLIAS